MRLDRVIAVVDWARGEYEKERRGEPSRWYQQMWVATDEWMRMAGRSQNTPCGTSYCVAGHVAVEILGLRPLVTDTGRAEKVTVDYEDRYIPDVAGEWLGLTVDEQDRLFAASNTIDDLELIVDEWRRESV